MPHKLVVAFTAALALVSGCRYHAGVFQGASVGASAEASRSLSTPRDSVPVLVALLPDSIHATSDSGTLIVVRGRHFAVDTTRGNTVRIGRLVLRRIIARGDGTELQVTVRALWSATEAPPAPLRPGSYAVTVRSDVGESNALTLRVLP